MTDASTPEERSTGRLKWRSRRGMLELELALEPFLANRLDDLSPADRARFERLLEHDDWDIFEWLQGREPAPDPDLAGIVGEIRAARGGLK